MFCRLERKIEGVCRLQEKLAFPPLYNLVAEDQADPVIVLFVGNIERPTERNQIKTPSFLST